MKELIIITGSFPPDICGVGDATNNTVNTKKGRDWIVYYHKNWKLSSLFLHIKTIKKTKVRYILMSFPTKGYGWSIVPHLLCIYFSWFTNKCFGVIVHEQSQLSLKAYLAELLILISANRIIFTTQYEQKYAVKRIPFIRNRSTVVKIISNITSPLKLSSIEERNLNVIYFGLIMPRKGLEKFIKDVTSLTKQYRVVIAGQVPPMFISYYKKIENLCLKNNIQLRINLEQAEVSELINNTKVAYLPFPDGISERRGSVLASLINGAVVVTTFGKYTTKELEKATINISGQSLQNILENNTLLIKKQKAGLEYINTQLPRDWEEIAKSYENFIKKDDDHYFK